MLKNVFEALSRARSESSQLQHEMLGGAVIPSSVPADGTAGILLPGPFPGCCSQGQDRAWRAFGRGWGGVFVSLCAALAKLSTHLGSSSDVLEFGARLGARLGCDGATGFHGREFLPFIEEIRMGTCRMSVGCAGLLPHIPAGVWHSLGVWDPEPGWIRPGGCAFCAGGAAPIPGGSDSGTPTQGLLCPSGTSPLPSLPPTAVFQGRGRSRAGGRAGGSPFPGAREGTEPHRPCLAPLRIAHPSPPCCCPRLAAFCR